MHVPDSADIGPGGLYTQGPPRSVIGRHALNALVQENLGVLAAAGVAPRGSGTIDAAAGYGGQVAQAIRRLIHKEVAVTSLVFSTNSLEDLPQTEDTHFFRITETGGGQPNGVVYPSASPVFINKLILVHNATLSRKYVATHLGISPLSPIPAVVPLAPGQAQAFLGIANGSDCGWVSLAQSAVRRGTFAALAHDSANPSNNVPINLQWVRNEATGQVSVFIPLHSITFGSGAGFYEIVPASGDIPQEIKSAFDQEPLMAVVKNGILTPMLAGIKPMTFPASVYIRLAPAPAIAATDILQITGQTFTYFGL